MSTPTAPKPLTDEASAIQQHRMNYASILEAERTKVCDAVSLIKKALTEREWLRLGRGSYEYDDDRWRDEFSAAVEDIRAALIPLENIASDLKGCPATWDAVVKAREDKDATIAQAHAENAALLQAASQVLEHDGGQHSTGYHAFKVYDARDALLKAITDPTAAGKALVDEYRKVELLWKQSAVEVERLGKSQRTPGTVEVCQHFRSASCGENEDHPNMGICGRKACPRKGPTTSTAP